MPSQIRLTYAGGTLAELLTLISNLRPAVKCKMRGATFLFYQGRLFGSANDEERLAELLDLPVTCAELVSTEKLDDLFY